MMVPIALQWEVKDWVKTLIVEYKNDDGEITAIEYREKAIVASYVGKGFSPVIKINRIAKGEGELTTARSC